MSFLEFDSYYVVLELSSSASQEEIETSYMRLKKAFQQENVAYYSLYSASQIQSQQHKIEEAYLVLSNPQKRKQYDRSLLRFSTIRSLKNTEESMIPSIDRNPPMEPTVSVSELLIPPETFIQEPSIAKSSEFYSGAYRSNRIRRQNDQTYLKNEKHQVALMQKLHSQQDWRGSDLEEVRNIFELSVEDLSVRTKISKKYLIALEKEDFSVLPASVYIRGFLLQIAKELKLPVNDVVESYMKRLQEYHDERKAIK